MVGSKFNAAAGPPDGLIEAILGSASDAIIASNSCGRITFWDPGATRIFGFTSEEAVGSSLDLIIPEALRARHWAGYTRVMATGESHYGKGDPLVFAAHDENSQRCCRVEEFSSVGASRRSSLFTRHRSDCTKRGLQAALDHSIFA